MTEGDANSELGHSGAAGQNAHPASQLRRTDSAVPPGRRTGALNALIAVEGPLGEAHCLSPVHPALLQLLATPLPFDAVLQRGRRIPLSTELAPSVLLGPIALPPKQFRDLRTSPPPAGHERRAARTAAPDKEPRRDLTNGIADDGFT